MARNGNIVQCLEATANHASFTKLFSDHPADHRRMEGIEENLRLVLGVFRRIEVAILIDHNPTKAERLIKEEFKFDKTTAAR